MCAYAQETFDRQEKEELRNRRARGEWVKSTPNDKSKHAPVYVEETASQKSHRVRNKKFNKVKDKWCAELKIPRELPRWLKEAKENPGMFRDESSHNSPKKGSSSSSSNINGSLGKRKSPVRGRKR